MMKKLLWRVLDQDKDLDDHEGGGGSGEGGSLMFW